MTIERNGMQIELTGEEMIQAWLEVDKWNKIEYIEDELPDEMPAVEKRELALKVYPVFEKQFNWNASWFYNLMYALEEVGVDI